MTMLLHVKSNFSLPNLVVMNSELFPKSIKQLTFEVWLLGSDFSRGFK